MNANELQNFNTAAQYDSGVEKPKASSENSDFIENYIAPLFWTGLLMTGLGLFSVGAVLAILFVSRLLGFHPDEPAFIVIVAGCVSAVFVPLLVWQFYRLVRQAGRSQLSAHRFRQEHRRIEKLKVNGHG